MAQESDYAAVIQTPLPGGGRLGLCLDAEGAVTAIDHLPAGDGEQVPARGAAHEAAEALRRWFRHPEQPIAIALHPSGTVFQQRVWAALRDIPSGRTVTYGELARRLQTAPRAVAGACRANPIPFLIPCHRVVAVGGPGGYMGETGGPAIELKQRLLAHERS